MINRRHVRIKVMQSVYALLKSKSDNLNKEEKFLTQSIEKLLDLYVLMLSLLIEIRLLAIKRLEITKSSHLATSEEKNPSKKFISNRLLENLSTSISIQNYLESKKLKNWKLDNEYVQIIFTLIQESDDYKSYMKSDKSSFDEDKKIVIDIFKNIIAPNEKLSEYFEDTTISWYDDIPFVNTWVVKTLKSLKETSPVFVGKLYKDEDDEKFVLDLFRKVVLNHDKYDEEIAKVTPNWELDRIADIDIILIKMAIVEFLKFPSIPTKVSINEYIEIAKDYSSIKSSFFINGVLDNLLKEYSAAKRIEKIGRGLL